jgi:hypothetical protein
MLSVELDRPKDRQGIVTHYPQDPNEAPDWAFGPDVGITCPLPDCGAALLGLNWKLGEITPTHSTKTEMHAEATVTAMILIPCGHELPTDVWELSFSGRDRLMGTVIRTPKFQRKDGS